MEMVSVYQSITRRLAGTSGSSWTNPCSSRASRAGCPGPRLEEEVTPSPWATFAIAPALAQYNSAFWCSDGAFSIPVCALCLLSSHRAPQKRSWLHPLCTFPSVRGEDPRQSLLFSRANNHSSPYLSSQEMLCSPFSTGLCGHLLDSLKYILVSLVLGGPELNLDL